MQPGPLVRAEGARKGREIVIFINSIFIVINFNGNINVINNIIVNDNFIINDNTNDNISCIIISNNIIVIKIDNNIIVINNYKIIIFNNNIGRNIVINNIGRNNNDNIIVVNIIGRNNIANNIDGNNSATNIGTNSATTGTSARWLVPPPCTLVQVARRCTGTLCQVPPAPWAGTARWYGPQVKVQPSGGCRPPVTLLRSSSCITT